MNNLSKVAKREYLQTIKKPSFWISTFAFPVLILGLAALSGFTSAYSEQQSEQQAHNQRILVLDEGGLLTRQLLPPTITLVIDSTEVDFELIKTKGLGGDNGYYAAIKIPQDLSNTSPVEIYLRGQGLFDGPGLETAIKTLLKNSVLEKIEDTRSKLILSDQLAIQTQSVEIDGTTTSSNLGMLAVPLAAMTIYLVLVSFSTSYLLRSVSEEKENRMIEVVLTAVTPRQLVWGKVIGQIGIVLTQFLTLAALTFAVLALAKVQIPAEILNSIIVTPQLLIFGIIFLALGFLTLAGLMVIAASAVPTYREAQAFSTAFILIGIIPFYITTIILAEPNGALATITSLLPLTSPLVMIMRLSITEINLATILLIILVNLGYLVLSFILAFKVFAWGALEYNRGINWKNLFSKV